VRLPAERRAHAYFPRPRRRDPSLVIRNARGQALLALLMMLSMAAMLLVYGSTSEAGRAVKSERKTRATLEYARQALIGRAIGDASRPGSLPCPDGDDDGSADLFVGSSCPTYIGRLPWRTLGLGDLRDASGERLWYVLSPPFRDHPAAPALNSDTHGTLTVYSSSEATTISRDAVAIVFSAGAALGGQRRDMNTAQCATDGKHIRQDYCAANYLDAASGFNNASAAGPYVTAPSASAYNDRLALIVTADFMPLVEQRVALEIRNALLAYKRTSACRCYPWADSTDDGTSDAGSSRGRLPVLKALPQQWGTQVLPAYVAQNDWARIVRYSASRMALENSGTACTDCMEATLTIDGIPGYELLLVTAGYAQSPAPRTTVVDYIDDLENRNGDDRYIMPTSRAADRDRIYPITTASAGCGVNARVLLHNLPCGSPQSGPRMTCEAAATALAACSCAAAASMLATGLCASTLTGEHCATPLKQLQACTS
jgi:hypothetical protein